MQSSAAFVTIAIYTLNIVHQSASRIVLYHRVKTQYYHGVKIQYYHGVKTQYYHGIKTQYHHGVKIHGVKTQ